MDGGQRTADSRGDEGPPSTVRRRPLSAATGLPSDPYTNPDELFDVYDASGQRTGLRKRRADVHRDGDWHRSFHCWVTSEAGPVPCLLLQRRGRQKDTWPNRLDATVGGHFAAGETLDDVVREVAEEIGLAVSLADLTPLGRRVSVSEQEAGIRDRELQEVYLWRSRAPLAAYRPQPVEVAAIEEVAIADLLRLFAGAASQISAQVLRPGGTMAPGRIGKEDFVPVLDGYFYRVATVVDQALRGYPYLVV
jgi:isopentenyldiphosphate isomerase